MLRKVKVGASLLCAMLAMLLFAACGSSSDHAASSSPVKSQANTQKQVELTVSAAASLTDALQELEHAFEGVNPGIRLNFNFGGSGSLQQQIEQGAPVDLFLSAAKRNMQTLVDKGMIDTGHQTNLLTNALVVVVPQGGMIEAAGLGDLAETGIKKIAIGIPESVPAGSYAKEALINSQLWSALQAKLVQAKDVRQVLQFVETGNVDAGFVYRTDAFTSDKIKIAFAVEPSSYTPVEYPIAVVKETKHQTEADAFFDYLQSIAALNVFEKYGFIAAVEGT